MKKERKKENKRRCSPLHAQKEETKEGISSPTHIRSEYILFLAVLFELSLLLLEIEEEEEEEGVLTISLLLLSISSVAEVV
jgi:hypothetical protein